MRKFTLPDEPTDVARIEAMDGSGKVFRFKPSTYRTSWGNWVDEDDTRYAWDEILNEWGGAIELTKSDVEKAIEFFEKKPDGMGYGHYLYHQVGADETQSHTQALIYHAKETIK